MQALRETTIPCTLADGIFDHEFAVTIESLGGPVHLLCDRSFVRADALPANGESLPGRLEVLLVGEEGNRVLVGLPVQSSYHTRVWVNADEVRAGGE